MNNFSFDYPIDNDFNLFSEVPPMNFEEPVDFKNLEFPIFDQSFEIKEHAKSESTKSSKSPRVVSTDAISESFFSEDVSMDNSTKTIIKSVEDNDPLIEKGIVEVTSSVTDDNTCMNNWINRLIDDVDDAEGQKRKRIISRKPQQRQRKSRAQVAMLRKYLKDFPDWDKAICASIAEATKLSNSQVYKWFWEQKSKH